MMSTRRLPQTMAAAFYWGLFIVASWATITYQIVKLYLPTLALTCGLYALYNLDLIETYGGSKEPIARVIGGVMALGKTVECGGEGFRSGGQKVLVLLDRSEENKPERPRQFVVQSFKVPLLKESEFMAYLAQRGEMASGQ